MIMIKDYPDTEAELVSCLLRSIEELNINNVRVGTQRLPTESRGYIDEVILRSNGNTSFGNLVDEAFTLYVWVYNNDENEAYDRAQNLSRQVLTALSLCISKSDVFRYISSEPSVSPVENEGTTQVRAITVSIAYYANTIRIK